MDLKIKDVAELLNISETTVRRYLTEGKIPAYKLNHQYRFSRTEIEDWVMKQKLEGTQSSTLSEKEQEPKAAMGSMQFSLYRALNRGTVMQKVPYKTKDKLFGHAMEYMAKEFNLDALALKELFLERERLMATSLGHGIGVPHTRDFLLKTHFDVVLVLYPEKPIEYEALDEKPVHTLFFLFASEDKNHLHLLAKLAHLTSNEKARNFLNTRPNKEQLLDYVKQWESGLN